MRKHIAVVASFALLIALTTGLAARDSPHKSFATGVVYVMTNDPSGNALLQFKRSSDGLLTLVDR